MRKSSKLLVATAAAALVATGGSAFTATSTIDKSTKAVGTTSQAVSGVNVTSVNYTVGADDTTTAVSFKVSQAPATLNTVNAKITSGTNTGTETAPVFATSNVNCTATADGTGSLLTCNFPTGVANVTKLDIVAS